MPDATPPQVAFIFLPVRAILASPPRLNPAYIRGPGEEKARNAGLHDREKPGFGRGQIKLHAQSTPRWHRPACITHHRSSLPAIVSPVTHRRIFPNSWCNGAFTWSALARGNPFSSVVLVPAYSGTKGWGRRSKDGRSGHGEGGRRIEGACGCRYDIALSYSR
ncbi:hypothetical protein VUR80DRAFT_9877 [Thermomyces stellatus]